MIGRLLAVLAAALLVCAVALAMLGPRGMTLGDALNRLDPATVAGIRSGLSRQAWLWDGIVNPLLVRPAWLLPAALGIVAAGVALTLTWSRVPSHKRRRS